MLRCKFIIAIFLLTRNKNTYETLQLNNRIYQLSGDPVFCNTRYPFIFQCSSSKIGYTVAIAC
jgi:hypothetical protein